MSESDILKLSTEIEKKILDDIHNSESKIINDVITGVNAKINPSTTMTPSTTYIPYSRSSESSTQSQNIINQGKLDYNSQYNDQTVGPSSNPVLRPNTNSVFQSGGMSIDLPQKQTSDTPGQIPSISEKHAKVNFPDVPVPPDIFSYYGALRSKGSEYVPSNTISETNKLLGRLDYVPPPLPPNLDFTYYGALRSKGTYNVKPLNALQGPNNYSEKILDEKLYAINGQPSYEELPIPNRIDYTMIKPEINMNNVSNYSSNPIDLYSQYGALVPKDNFYNK
jgi:hypothetical protein